MLTLLAATEVHLGVCANCAGARACCASPPPRPPGAQLAALPELCAALCVGEFRVTIAGSDRHRLEHQLTLFLNVGGGHLRRISRQQTDHRDR